MVKPLIANGTPVELSPKWEDLSNCSEMFQIYKWKGVQPLDLHNHMEKLSIPFGSYIAKTNTRNYIDFVIASIPEEKQATFTQLMTQHYPRLTFIKITPERKIVEKTNVTQEQESHLEAAIQKFQSDVITLGAKVQILGQKLAAATKLLIELTQQIDAQAERQNTNPQIVGSPHTQTSTSTNSRETLQGQQGQGEEPNNPQARNAKRARVDNA